MNLLVCDLDGTLTRTIAVDEECFVQAFLDVFSIHDLNTNWMEYRHITDLGVLQQVFQERFNRMPAPDDIARFSESFVSLLSERYATSSNHFGEIPGAASLLTRFTRHSRWPVAIATGCLAASAKFKMRMAGLRNVDIPIACAEDGPSREAIVRTAIARAKEHYKVPHFERIVSAAKLPTISPAHPAERMAHSASG